jgi:hypothetical protein
MSLEINFQGRLHYPSPTNTIFSYEKQQRAASPPLEMTFLPSLGILYVVVDLSIQASLMATNQMANQGYGGTNEATISNDINYLVRRSPQKEII